MNNSRYRLVILDLDGTLIDSKQDLVDSVNATRAHMGLDPLAPAVIASYVGHGAAVLIRRVMGAEASEDTVAAALEYFIRYYHDHCLDATTLYPGSRQALDALRAADVQLAILTNKPVRISQRIIEGLSLRDHFFQIYGGNSFEQKKPHPVGIETLLRETGIAPGRTLMVGDSSVDIETARNAHVDACGVTFGFAPGSLAEARPDYLIGHMAELPPIVLAI